MKFKFLFATLILFFTILPVTAQQVLFRPFTSLRVIQTEYFYIIFPRESEPSARALASYADSVYLKISALLGIELPHRIPVTITPHTDMFNGFFSGFNHIVLFDTPMNIEWTTFSNSLKGLFIHELTHAVSLNSRTPFFNFLYRIFGAWVMPATFNAPGFMVEGVAISFESLDGAGRANDPRIRQYLRQAAFENKFLTPFQASRVYDRPIQPRGYWYEYGGLFSAWLIETYGMEKYAELWRQMGRFPRYSLAVYRSSFYNVFRRVYGRNFLDVWDDFRVSLLIEDLEINDDELLPRTYRHFREREKFIRTLIARGNNLYFIDRTERNIGIYDTVTGRLRTINIGSQVYDIDVCANTGNLLLSTYNFAEDRAFAVVNEHRANGRRTGRTINGLYRARYFRDGVIGVRSNLHNTNIVFEDFNGRSEILLAGNASLLFSGPQVIDDERFAFVAARNGKRELWLYNYVSQELFLIESASGEINHWQHMRNLSVSEGRLFFSHNADDRMYKAAYVDLQTMQAVFSGRDFSGGVFHPVSVNDTIYYIGAFVERDRLLRFPEPASSMTGERIPVQLIRLDNFSFEPIREQPDLDASLYTPSLVRNPLSDNPFYGIPFHNAPSRRYFALRHMNPLSFWFPVPLVRSYDRNLSLDGGGFFTIMTDPTSRNMLTILAFADIRNQMAMINHFTWQNTAMGFPLTFDFRDEVIENSNFPYPYLPHFTGEVDGRENAFRFTSVNLSGSFSRYANRFRQTYWLGTGYIRRANFQEGRGAYEWQETRSGFNTSLGFIFSFDRMSLRLSGISFLDNFEPRIDGVFSAHVPVRFPLNFTLFGAYDKLGMNLHGRSRNYGNRLIGDHTLIEYPHPLGLNLNWFAGGEAAVNIFSVEIQRHISHFHFNRIFGILSLRNQLYDSDGHPRAEGVEIGDLRLAQSLTLRVASRISFLTIVKFPVYVEPFISGSWKFSNNITGNGSLWFAHIGLRTSF